MSRRRCALLPDFVTYIVAAIGLLGIGLGVFTLVRPKLSGWRGLFPSDHDQDLRMMEEALAGIYRGGADREVETFRSYFSRGREDEDDLAGEPSASAASEGTGDYVDHTTPEDLLARYGARSVSLKHADSEIAPKVVMATMPGTDDNAQSAPEPEEEEDVLSDVLTDEGLGDPKSGNELDDDLRSLFEETEEFHAVPDAVRKALPDVTIESLVADAREIWSLIGTGAKDAVA